MRKGPKDVKRMLSILLVSLLLGGIWYPSMESVAATQEIASEDKKEALPSQEDDSWAGFEEFSSAVSELIRESGTDAYISSISLEVGEPEMVVDGETQPVVEGRNVTPVTKDEAILLPVRALPECENASVTYDSATKTATVQTEDEKEISFTRGEAVAVVSSEESEEAVRPLSAEPELKNGTMYVPLDAMTEFLGYDVEVVEDKVLLTKPYQTKRLIVKSEEEDLEDFGAIKEVSGFNDLHVLQYETEQEARDAQTQLMLSEKVDYVEPDLVVSTAEVHKSWGTDYVGADTYNAFLQENTSLEEVIVAVVDTGVDSAHEFLKDRIIPVNKNFVNSEPNSNDGHSHGTHVAGIIRDATLPNVKILPVKSLDDQGKGSTLSIYNGLMFAISQNCDVINMSLGGYGKSELQEETIREAVSQNISVVVAAGNDSIDASWETPSRVPEAITVGAIASSGGRASYSNYGDVVDIWAPGSEILSSVPGNQYEKKNGTSMASPLVAAAAAMLKTYDKTLSPRQIEAILHGYGTSSWFYFPTG